MPDELEEVKTQEEVAEDATPETNEEAEEQREDDYQGIARRIDEVASMVAETLDAIKRVEGGMGVFVESGATITEGGSAIEEVAEEVLEEILDLEDLELEL